MRRRGSGRAPTRRSTASAGLPSPVRSARHLSFIASSSRIRIGGFCSQTKRTGRVWCGAGAVSASATAASTSCGGDRLVGELAHRAAQQLGLLAAQLDGFGGAQPEQVVLAGPQQVARRRRRVGAGRGSPRTTATGIAVSLPLTRSAAAAISSATAISVTINSLPCRSTRTRVAVQHRQPAAPIAASVWPLRHARPMVSVTTTPTVTPSRSRSPVAQRRGAGVGIDGQQRQFGCADVGSVYAGGGLHQPSAFSVISVRPLRASTRTASASISLRRSVSRAPRDRRARRTIRPSHLDTTLLVTTRTSPSRSQGAAAAIAAARSSPGRNSGSPVTGRISTAAAVPCSPSAVGHGCHPRELQSGAHHLGRRRRVGHQQRHRPHRDPVDFGVVTLVDQPAVQDAGARCARR